MSTVAKVLVKHLKKWGITHVFGIPGKPVVPIVLEVENQELTYILSRHESGAGFAAAGYALANKSLGVAIATSGPGGTNSLTAAGQAKAYNLPVLFITGHPSVKANGIAQGQDSSIFGTDLVKMFEPVTLFSARVEHPDLFQSYFQHALENAFIGVKGPVHLSIPADILLAEIEDFDIELPVDSYSLISNRLEEVIELLDCSEKKVMLIGKGVHASKAYDEVQAFAEKWSIPVVTSPGGKGAFVTNHPLSLGGFGLGGTEQAEQYMNQADVLVVIGTKLSDMTLPGFTPEKYPQKVIQFDCDPTFIGKSIPVPTLPVLGDAKVNLQKILALTGDRKTEVQSIRVSPTENAGDLKSHFISAKKVMKLMRQVLPDETLVFGDDGSHTYFAILHYDIVQPGTFIFDDVFGTMGHAISYAVGAKIASPQRPVVSLTGDGCTLMHGTEISTAVCNHIPVLFIVLNNGRLDMVDKGMKHHLGRSVGTIFETPVDVTAFAQSMGAKAFQCHYEEEIIAAIQFGLQHDGPTVIEIMVDPEEVPPTLKRG